MQHAVLASCREGLRPRAIPPGMLCVCAYVAPIAWCSQMGWLAGWLAVSVCVRAIRSIRASPIILFLTRLTAASSSLPPPQQRDGGVARSLPPFSACLPFGPWPLCHLPGAAYEGSSAAASKGQHAWQVGAPLLEQGTSTFRVSAHVARKRNAAPSRFRELRMIVCGDCSGQSCRWRPFGARTGLFTRATRPSDRPHQ